MGITREEVNRLVKAWRKWSDVRFGAPGEASMVSTKRTFGVLCKQPRLPWGRSTVISRAKAFDPYRGRDPRDIPAYTVGKAAHYLLLPERTVQGWVQGRPSLRQRAVIPSDPETGLLSFAHLLELHVLAALRREHGVTMQNARRVRDWLQQKWGSAHPLIDEEMQTDGTHVFVRRLGDLINASREGQLAIEEMISARLTRIERDKEGLASRLYPFTRKAFVEQPGAPKLVTIDARYVFGRPVITGSRIPTAEIAERFYAGDSYDTLVEEYGRRSTEIEEAIRYESWRAAA